MEAEVGQKPEAIRHCFPRFGKDLTTAITALSEAKVFANLPNRQHPSFKFKCNLLETCPRDKLLDWLFERVSSMIVLR